MGPPKTLISQEVCKYLVPHCLAARAAMTKPSRTSPMECLANAIEMILTSMDAAQSASCNFWEAEPFVPQHRMCGTFMAESGPREEWGRGLSKVSSSVAGNPQQGHC
eukprot:9855789-Heterocapsa_arctica.AAC.1